MSVELKPGWLARDVALAAERLSRSSGRTPNAIFLEEYTPGQGRKKKYSATIAIPVTPEFKETLNKLAWYENVSMSHLARTLLEVAVLEFIRKSEEAENV